MSTSPVEAAWQALARHRVSLARTQTIRSSVGTFSFHHVTPELFGGFERTSAGTPLATPEKALFDVAYLSGVRSRLFASLPELTK